MEEVIIDTQQNDQENDQENVQEKKCKDRTLLLLVGGPGRGGGGTGTGTFVGDHESDESGDTLQVVRRTTTSSS